MKSISVTARERIHSNQQLASYLSTNGQVMPLIDTPELAKTLGVSTRTVLSWRQKGRIPYLQPSLRLIRYSLPAVLQALSK